MLCMKQHVAKNSLHIHQVSTSAQSFHGTTTGPFVPKDNVFVDSLSGIVFIRIPGDELASPPLKDFWLGKYPVTQEQWRNVMGKMNPSHFKNRPSAPVENISWKDAMRFIQKMAPDQQKERATSGGKTPEQLGDKNNALDHKRFRLPTVIEWEYASNLNAGYLASDLALDRHCWHSQNSQRETHPVGNKLPNDFGLYDMFGNVWEWCGDTTFISQREPKNSRQGMMLRLLSALHTYLVLPLKSTRYRTLCGGSWSTSPEDIRTRHTICKHVKEKNNSLGFRVAFSCDRKTSA